MAQIESMLIIVLFLIELACMFFFFPKIYYYLSTRLSINFITAWKRYILINVILVMISPTIIGIICAYNIETAINAYINTLVNVPYLSTIHIVISICSIFIYAGNICKTKKASEIGLLLTVLGLVFCWLSTIIILGIINPRPITVSIPTLVFLYLDFNGFVPLIEAILWHDFFSGEFGISWNIDKIKKLLKKGDELYNEVPEFKKFIDDSDSRKPLGKKAISIKLITVDEAYQYAFGWVTQKSVIVFWDKPKIIVARRCFETGNEYGMFTENILQIFIYIKIKEGYEQVDIETSLFPIKKSRRRKIILEKETLKVLDDL
jgi:hypothetical protein